MQNTKEICLKCIEEKQEKLGSVLDYMGSWGYRFGLFTGPRVVDQELELLDNYVCTHAVVKLGGKKK